MQHSITALIRRYPVYISGIILLFPLLYFAAVPKSVLDTLITGCYKTAIASKTQEPDARRFKFCVPVEPRFKENESTSAAKIKTAEKKSRIDGRLVISLTGKEIKKNGALIPVVNPFLKHITYRYSYGISMFALMTACFAAIIVALQTIGRIHPAYCRKCLIGGMAFLIGLILAYEFSLSFSSNAKIGGFSSLIGKNSVAKFAVIDPLNQVAEKIAVIHPEAADGFNRFNKAFEQYQSRTLAFTLFSFLIVVASLTAVTVLASARTMGELEINRKHLNHLLTATAIMFAIFVIYIRSYVRLAQPFISNSQDVEILGNALVYFWSASTSIILLATFGLMFWIHSLQVNRRSQLVTDGKLAEAPKTEESLMDRLIALLKVFLPLIAGMAFDISNLL